MNKFFIALLLVTSFLFIPNAKAQLLQEQDEFSKADSLRGSITAERAWWDVTFYDLSVNIFPEDSTISGYNHITYRVTDSPKDMQIDLQPPLEVDQIRQDGNNLDFTREGNAFFVDMPGELKRDSLYTISIYYQGKPKVAENAPWDGGFVWATDSLGNPWIATANQGLGASVWWPTKDHQSDEPDSMDISITVPKPLVNVSNGRLKSKTVHENSTTYTWHVSNPINNYNVAVNAGNYVNFTETYEGEYGTLDLSYWVLEQYLQKAQEQFKQVKPMMKCFEEWFGPYPFYEDSFKLVHTPHLGMEHQSAVAYGNAFRNGYRGTDLSGSGWGLKWDFIIIHEAAHEWWGNNITTNDIADMWVHEGFTSYAENIYVECRFGKEAGAEYARGLRDRIKNEQPVTGTYGLNDEGSGDMYYKGNNMLHTLRQIVDNDSTWKNILRGLQETFRYETVNASEVERYIIAQSGKDLDDVFDQYLHYAEIPVFQYYFKNDRLYYKWKADVTHFDMPMKVGNGDGRFIFIYPTSTRWKSSDLDLDDSSDFQVDPNFYIQTERLGVSNEQDS
ncbi:M1 family metallopeptidase [Halalkalibaculum roseum]|nr:M1 family metallopeptidase [Halalkalibaculum roseum]